MKQSRAYPRFTVTDKAACLLENGHPWVYDTEITACGQSPNGGLADVVDRKGKWLGTAFLSETSKIRLRLISRNPNDRFDNAFWERRVRYAWEYRKAVMGGELDGCRVIFGEADQMPGLTVDKFHDVLVTQTLSRGMDAVKDRLFPILYRVISEDIPLRGIFERNDVALRAHEGLPAYKGWYALEGKADFGQTKTELCENGIFYEVDFENGQKTGFFLDQKYNRRAVAGLAKDKTVLDCFTHTGSFGLNAAKGGAKKVLSADISHDALETARRNAARNGLQNVVEYREANVFELLTALDAEKCRGFDFIILDPPAFTKSRKTVDSAARGYKEINLKAMRLLPRGGYLATCSCSHFMTDRLFVNMLLSAARDAGRQLRQIEARQQAPDHPILWGVPETDYLKFYLFQVI